MKASDKKFLIKSETLALAEKLLFAFFGLENIYWN